MTLIINPEDRFNDVLTEQDIFNHGVYHLGTMPEQCTDGVGTCLYRNAEGNSCAVGYFLKDDEVKLKYNSKGVNDLNMAGMLPERLVPHITLLTVLQVMHDSRGNWDGDREKLKEVLKGRGEHLRLNLEVFDLPEMAWNKKRSLIDVLQAVPR